MSSRSLEGVFARMEQLEKENVELRRAVGRLGEREEQYRLLADNVTDVIWMRDMNLQFTYLSPSVEKLTGYTVEEAMALPLEKAYTPDAVHAATKRFQEVMAMGKGGKDNGEKSWTVEMEGFCKDGSRKWTEAKMKFVRDREGRPVGLLGVSRDITERKRAEEEQRESEERYRSLVENTLDGYFVCKIPNGEFVFLNQRNCDLIGCGMEEALRLTIWDVIHPQEHPRFKGRFLRAQEGGRAILGPEICLALRRDGASFRMEISTSTVIFGGERVVQGIMRDVTANEILRRQLQQAQRMESIGTLAGGIAHDFNNLLMAIQGNVSLLLCEKDASSGDHEYLKNIEKQVKSGAKLTRQLLGYAGKGRYEVSAFDLNGLVKDTAVTFGRMRKEINIRWDLDRNLLPVEGEEGQIEQVLMNLLVNGADAMPEGGDLTLETKSVTHEELEKKAYDPTPGCYVLLTVRDTGEGMDPVIQDHIFEPFFTTKEMGRGTGLGLAAAYGIVKAHKGYIDFESKAGEGTTFRIYLPATEKPIQRPPRVGEGIACGEGTILLVDDEEAVLDIECKVLKKLGYTALTAKGGKQALQLFSERRDEIDLVVLDMIMPDMNGGEVYDRMKEIKPDVKVLLSSGYSMEGQAAQIVKRGCRGFIQKPFSMLELSNKIRWILCRE